jgi:hypothetical protein
MCFFKDCDNKSNEKRKLQTPIKLLGFIQKEKKKKEGIMYKEFNTIFSHVMLLDSEFDIN